MIIFYLVLLIITCLGVRFVHFNDDYLSRKTTLTINGFFVLLIFARHFSGYAILENNVLDTSFKFIDSLLGQLVVVSFLFFSGYGVCRSVIINENYIKKFPFSRILFLYFQFACCLMIFLVISFIPVFKTDYSLNRILLSFTGWTDIGNSNWFIFVILIQYIIVYFCFRFLNRKKIAAGLCFSTVISIFLFIFLYVYKPSHWYNTLLCFNLGMWYGFLKEKIDTAMKKPVVYWAVFIVISLLFGGLFATYLLLDVETIYFVVSLLFSIFIVVISMKIRIQNLFLLFFGTHAFSIYMLQRASFIVCKPFITNHYLFFITTFLLTIIVSVLFDFFFSGFKCRRFKSRNPIKKYFKNILFQLKKDILTCKIFINKIRIKIKVKQNKKISIIFVVQYPEMWNSEKSVYEKLLLDSHFSVSILAVPKNIYNGLKKGMKENKFFETNDSYEYLSKKYKNVINSFDNGRWINLKKLNPDILFVQRPYEDNLPKCYSFNKISKIALLCYIPYDGTDFSKEKHVSIGLNEKLLQNCAYFFSATDVHRNYFEKNKYSSLSKSFFSGCPRFDLIQAYTKKSNKQSNKKTFLWLPRWYFENGGNNQSSFIKYVDALIDFFLKQENLCLIIRPHPLMFGKLVESKLISEKQLEDMILKINRSNNISFDKNIDYLDTFKNADYLISDYTSLLIEFFMFNKPIFYCDTTEDFNNLGVEVSKFFINVTNQKELIDRINFVLNNPHNVLKDDTKLIANLNKRLARSAERVSNELRKELL